MSGVHRVVHFNPPALCPQPPDNWELKTRKSDDNEVGTIWNVRCIYWRLDLGHQPTFLCSHPNQTACVVFNRYANANTRTRMELNTETDTIPVEPFTPITGWCRIPILIPDEYQKIFTETGCYSDTDTSILLLPIPIPGYWFMPILIMLLSHTDTDNRSFLVSVEHYQKLNYLKMEINAKSIRADI